LNSLFLIARLTHQKENHKLPGRVTQTDRRTDGRTDRRNCCS